MAQLPCHPLPQFGSRDAGNAAAGSAMATAATPAAAAAATEPATAASHLAAHLAALAALSRCPSVGSESSCTSGDVTTWGGSASVTTGANMPWGGSASVQRSSCSTTGRSTRELEGFGEEETGEEVEDVQDILKHLGQPPNTLPTRFPWVQGRPVSVTAMAPSCARRSSTMSSSARVLTRGSMQVRPPSQGPTRLNSVGTSSMATQRGPAVGSQVQKGDRDPRSELKRLRDELSGSVRNAFEGSDAWDENGGELDFLQSNASRRRSSALQIVTPSFLERVRSAN